LIKKWLLKLRDCFLYLIGVISSGFLIFNSFEGEGVIDFAAVIPGVVCLVACFKALIVRWNDY